MKWGPTFIWLTFQKERKERTMEKEFKDRMSKSFPELTKNLDSGRTIISKQNIFKKSVFIWTFVNKVMSLPFNILSGFVVVSFCEVGRIGEKGPKWRWLKDLEGKARENRTKEGPRTGVRTSGKTNNAPAQAQFTQGRPRDRETYKKRSQSPLLLWLPPSPVGWGDLFAFLDGRALTPQRWISLLLSK